MTTASHQLMSRLRSAGRVYGSLVRHPLIGLETARAGVERRSHDMAWRQLGGSPRWVYPIAEDWPERLQALLGAGDAGGSPHDFTDVWENVVRSSARVGIRLGPGAYAGWSDGDRSLAQAIWCVVAQLQPATVVETGVARGVTSRMVLERLKRNASGHLWSIDLPVADPAVHSQVGIAVPESLRSRWTYIEGSAGRWLPRLLETVGTVDVMIHDSVSTRREVRDVLRRVWPHLRPGGAVIVDDVHCALEFLSFVHTAHPAAWLVGPHHADEGLWGLMIKR